MMTAFSNISLEEVINLHLRGTAATASNPRVIDGRMICSSLSQILQEANHSVVKQYGSPLLPVMGYMSVLEQIGNCYSIVGNNSNLQNGIKRSLEIFANTNRAEVNALYGLRNAIVHNASIIHIDNGNGVPSMPFFLEDFPANLSHANVDAIKSLNTTPWDGNLQSLDRAHFTTVSVLGLYQLTARVIQNVIHHYENGTLGININHTRTNTDEAHKEYIIKRYLYVLPA